MYRFQNNASEPIAAATDTLYASPRVLADNKDYQFKKLTYPDVRIPNRSVAWRLYSLGEDEQEKAQLRTDIDEYNAYIDQLNCIPGFLQYFVESHYRIHRNSVSEHWSEDVATQVFSKKNYIFSTDLCINENYLYDNTMASSYFVEADGGIIELPLGANAEEYPTTVAGKRIIWNFLDNGRDFLYMLWSLLGERTQPDNLSDEAAESYTGPYYAFEFYDQTRFDGSLEIQWVKIFRKLESLGYLKSYTIHPIESDPNWCHYGKSDQSIDCAFIDMSFMKNKLLMEQIELIMWADTSELINKPYFLTDNEGKQYLSELPGKFGGHYKLKIYGRLNCKSAGRHIANGEYVKYRVFFADDKVAISAGYRPCGICMKNEYKKWKADKEYNDSISAMYDGLMNGIYQ